AAWSCCICSCFVLKDSPRFCKVFPRPATPVAEPEPSLVIYRLWLRSQPLPLPCTGKCRPDARELFPLRGVDLRVSKAEVLHRVHDRRGDKEPGEPLVVGRHDKPRRVI